MATYYFCPNCGTKLDTAPLSTTPAAQAWLYSFSIILPLICFITITKWPAVRYYKSSDPKAQTIGKTAIALIVLSTIVTIWLAYVFTEAAIQSTLSSLNADMSATGN